jgi:hypothetical protein
MDVQNRSTMMFTDAAQKQSLMARQDSINAHMLSGELGGMDFGGDTRPFSYSNMR